MVYRMVDLRVANLVGCLVLTKVEVMVVVMETNLVGQLVGN